MIEFKLPELGENIEQGDLVRLMVAPGATVNAGQSVMELETDKAVVEVPSSVSGTVQEIRVKEGDKIKVGQVIFTVDGAETKPRGNGRSAGRGSDTRSAQRTDRRTRACGRERTCRSESRASAVPPATAAPSAPAAPAQAPANSSFRSSAKTSRPAIWCA